MAKPDAEKEIEADCEGTFRRLLTDRPRVAWPTVLLTVGYLTLMFGSIALAVAGLMPVSLAIGLATIGSYWSYSVTHEAAHGLVSTNKTLNDWIGRISLLGISITPFFLTYRFLHLAHHRFVNDPAKDPDYWSGAGPRWALPWRWMTMDLAYALAYFRAGYYWERPRAERLQFWASMVFGLVVLGAIIELGWLQKFLLLYVLPTRIGLTLLAFAFDFLPHFPHQTTAREDMFRATSNRIGMEWLMTPLFVGQNYHLAHHLYPTTPFYRYRQLWLSRKAYHEARGAVVSPLGLHPSYKEVQSDMHVEPVTAHPQPAASAASTLQ